MYNAPSFSKPLGLESTIDSVKAKSDILKCDDTKIRTLPVDHKVNARNLVSRIYFDSNQNDNGKI